MSDENKFIGGPEDLSYDFTEEEICRAAERREQFQAELLRELNGKTNPTEEEHAAAVKRITERLRERKMDRE